MSDNSTVAQDQLEALLKVSEEHLLTAPGEILKQAREAISTARASNHSELLSHALLLAGRALQARRMAPEALEYYLLAARNFMAQDDKPGLCRAHIRLGSVYARLERFETAMRQLEQARSFAVELCDDSLHAESLLHLGTAYRRLARYEEARKLFEESREMAQSAGDAYAVARVTLRLGELDSQLERWPDAVRQLEQTRSAAERSDWPYTLTRSLIRLGCTLERAGERDRGYQLLAQGLTCARRYNADWLVLMAYEALARFFLMRDDHQQSLEYHRKHAHLLKRLRHKIEIERVDKAQLTFEQANACDESLAPTFVDQRELTERRDELGRAYEELRAQGEKLNAVFNNAVVGISVVDRFGQFRFINDYWAQMLGYSVEEVYRLKNLNVTHPEDATESFQQFIDLIEGRVSRYTARKRYIRKDGSSFWAMHYASSIHDSNGAVEAFIGVIVDIDEQVRNEEALGELQRQNAALALAVTASHEINQPLQLLRSNLEMMEMLSPELIEGPSSKYAAHMHQAIDRIADILETFRRSKSVRFDEYAGDTEMAVLDEEQEA